MNKKIWLTLRSISVRISSLKVHRGSSGIDSGLAYRRGSAVLRTAKEAPRYSASRRERMQLTTCDYLLVKVSRANEDARRCAHPSEINAPFTLKRTRSFHWRIVEVRCKCSRCPISNWFWMQPSHGESIVCFSGRVSKWNKKKTHRRARAKIHWSALRESQAKFFKIITLSIVHDILKE